MRTNRQPVKRRAYCKSSAVPRAVINLNLTEKARRSHSRIVAKYTVSTQLNKQPLRLCSNESQMSIISFKKLASMKAMPLTEFLHPTTYHKDAGTQV